MNWTFTIDGGEPLRVDSSSEIRGALAGILVGAGMVAGMADSYGRVAREMAMAYESDRRMNRKTGPFEYAQWLPGGDGSRTVMIRSDELPEDPNVRCDGYDSSGDKCGKNMNHLPPCSH